MAEHESPQEAPLRGQSPFELRVNLGKGVPETDVRTALSTGDMGFLHSFTTGSTVDGPGVRVVAWTTGCNWHCLYCHNPDTWTMSNGIPVTLARAKEELSKYRYIHFATHGYLDSSRADLSAIARTRIPCLCRQGDGATLADPG